MYFETFLKNYGIPPNIYLNIAKNNALNYGLDPDNLYLSNDIKHKLIYKNGNKNIYFGSNGNGDFIIYSLLEKMNVIPKGTAQHKQYLYISRASNISGNWKRNPISKNNLAINILW